jgi:hypothetical protein
MTDKENKDDDYELPTGIILPEDSSPDYPNWKKGIIFGIIGGIIGALLFWQLLTNKAIGSTGLTVVVGFITGFIILGAIAAFRPQKY